MQDITDKVRKLLVEKAENIEEKRMFGGTCFMVNNKMCVTTRPERIMVRIDPNQFEKLAETENISAMNHGGKVMPGFIFVNVEELTNQKLKFWVEMALEYNKIAPESKKKKKDKN